jgi:hypothetical protein
MRIFQRLTSYLWQLMTSRHYVIFMYFLSQFGVHKATYAARKEENWRNMQRSKTCHYWKKMWHDLIRPKHAFDIMKNVSRWLKRDTIWWIPNSVSCYTRWKRVTIYLKRETILGEFLCLFKMKSIPKKRVTI